LAEAPAGAPADPGLAALDPSAASEEPGEAAAASAPPAATPEEEPSAVPDDAPLDPDAEQAPRVRTATRPRPASAVGRDVRGRDTAYLLGVAIPADGFTGETRGTDPTVASQFGNDRVEP